jgi:transposase
MVSLPCEMSGLLVVQRLSKPDPRSRERNQLWQWITDARAADLPYVHSCTRGLDLDIQAATAAVTLPHHNGRTEGVNTKTILWNAPSSQSTEC